MRIFIAGIMQGSRTDKGIDDQDYRRELAQILQNHIDRVEIIDPITLHPESVDYSPEQAKQTLLELLALAGQVDVLIAFVPTASMGTALEMWHAYQGNARVYTISPLTSNWVVQSFSERIFSDVAAFTTFVADGGLVQANNSRGE